jgi:Fe2+ or Zn2+ uptake regulation protein
MKRARPTPQPARLLARLEENGFRLTPQRRHVYQVLLSRPDHPTADEVFLRAKREMPEISMATVYNTLDALVQSKLVRLVNHDRGATRYCSNMRPHHHFCCDVCGAAFDIDEQPGWRLPSLDVPGGFQADRCEIVVRGRCPRCARPGPARRR